MRIGYEIKEGTPRFTEWSEDGAPEVVFSVSGAPALAVRVGKSCIKIQNSEGRVKFSELKDGIFTPILTTEKECVRLLPIRVARGTVRLECAEWELARLNVRLLAIEEELVLLKTETEELKLKIYGKGIL